jgi:hypothetical protein
MLSLLVACIVSQASAQASAQSQHSIVGVHNLTVGAETCGRFRLNSEYGPARATYLVETFPQLTVRAFF